MHPQLAGLFAACANAHEFDIAPWLILADWLDEHDDPRGEYVRICRRGAICTDMDHIAVANYWIEHPMSSMVPEDRREGWLSCRLTVRELSQLAWSTLDWPTRIRVEVEDTRDFAAIYAAMNLIPPQVNRWIRIGLHFHVLPYNLHIAEQLTQLPRLDFLRIAPDSAAVSDEQPAFPYLPDLRELTLSWQNYSPFELIDLPDLPRLESLNLHQPPLLSDESITAIGEMPSLRRLMIRGNAGLDAAKISDWNADRTLRSLWLNQPVTGRMLSEITEWTGLIDLTLSNLPSLPGASVDSLAQLTTLEQLRLFTSETSLPTSLMVQLAKLPRLRQLTLSTIADMTDNQVAPLRDAKRLDSLDLDGNPLLTERTLDHLAKIPTLRWLNISDCEHIPKWARVNFRKQRPDCTLNG